MTDKRHQVRDDLPSNRQIHPVVLVFATYRRTGMNAMVFMPKNLQTIFKIFHAVVKPLDLLVEDHRHDIVGAVLTEWPEVARLVNVYFNPVHSRKNWRGFPRL